MGDIRPPRAAVMIRLWEREPVNASAACADGRHRGEPHVGNMSPPRSRCWHGRPRIPDPSLRFLPNRKRRRPVRIASTLARLVLSLVIFSSCLAPAAAVLIPFENCLSRGVIESEPVQLQFRPYNVSAFFDTMDAGHNLNVTVYGDVVGSATTTPPPPPDSPSWKDRNNTLGKIPDVSQPNNEYSTFFASFGVLTYTPFEAPAATFCSSLIHGECPLGPAFGANKSDLMQLPALSAAHEFYSTYAFATITPTLSVTAGDSDRTFLACVSANITPDLGKRIGGLLAFLPLAILVVVGLATISAAIFSPWGSSDTFKWTSNYGRDEDLLRLITPGFGDCLQYIQFVVLTGSLTLNYPGYYQPVVSQVSWSSLMFNTSFVSHGDGTQNPIDGIYVTNGTHGLERLSQLVGMSSAKDIWAGMIIWLLAIVVAGVAFIQFGFLLRWGYRHLSNIQEEDLRAKNLPFTLGNVVRVVCNYFLLPIVALSMFQFVISGDRPVAPASTGLAVLLLVILLGFILWALRVILSTRPRSFLFDDLPCVLLYGPLYNTYDDDAALFASVPLVLQVVRGVAIGAVQPSGIAQIILLAICEILLILTVLALRPFPRSTSMNAYHIFFAIFRLLTTFLSVAFVPSLGVTEAPKGWIGYVILLLHAIVLVFGFLLNAVQTLIEVGARLAGAGGEEGVGGGVARGGLSKVFGMRQLSRRTPRDGRHGRNSRLSDAELLGDSDAKSQLRHGRARSTSGSSAVLLNRHAGSDGRLSLGLDSLTGQTMAGHVRGGSGSTPYTPTTPGALSTFSHSPGQSAVPGGIMGLRTAEPSDPYYRPPRARRMTGEEYSPGTRSRGSWHSSDWANRRWSQTTHNKGESMDPSEGPSLSGRVTPMPPPPNPREISEINVNDPQGNKPDYAVREVDFYYGVRGPALSNMPARRLGTGPADPTGPIASTAGWLKGLFGGKTKDKGKGFEVVRSSRAPPPMQPPGAPVISQDSSDLDPHEVPATGPNSTLGSRYDRASLDDIGVAIGPEGPERFHSGDDSSSLASEEEWMEEDADRRVSRVAELPPSLPGIDAGGGIELPSRISSKASSRSTRETPHPQTPKVPRKSSKRKSTTFAQSPPELIRLSAIAASPPTSPAVPENAIMGPPAGDHHLRPSVASSSRMPFGSEASSASDNQASTGANSRSSSMRPSNAATARNSQDHGHGRHSSSALGSLSPDTQNDRPTSVGYVQQHRASDNIHIVSAGGYDGVNYQGSAAELIDDPIGNTSLERRTTDYA
ncbi:MAG: hypothetical protein M1837_003391 [Sclerophora amabilis]|nr:MAG: hypothetical protein M1837_003391 [Sclerophora amabilis]